MPLTDSNSETEVVKWLIRSESPTQTLQDTINHRDRKERRASKGSKACASIFADPEPWRQKYQKAPVSKKRRSTCKFRKRFAVPLGHLLLCQHVRTQNRLAGSLDCDIQTSKFQLTFLPRPLFPGQGISITATRYSCSDATSSSLNLQFRPMVADDSPIFNACRLGDINAMKFLFQQRHASPHVLNENGEDLILVSTLSWLFILMLVQFSQIFLGGIEIASIEFPSL